MKGIILYKWAVGSQAAFMQQYNGNQTLSAQAQQFWHNLSNYAPIAFASCLIISAAMTFVYYKPFNEMPGRHYQPKFWWLFFFVTAFIVCLVTYISEIAMIKTNLNNVASIEIKLAFANTLYSIGFYTLFSFVWCKAFTTNAYKMF